MHLFGEGISDFLADNHNVIGTKTSLSAHVTINYTMYVYYYCALAYFKCVSILFPLVLSQLITTHVHGMPYLLIMLKNSALVFGLLSKQPRTQLVTVFAPTFCTPLITIQK